jgi:hypothetical protein
MAMARRILIIVLALLILAAVLVDLRGFGELWVLWQRRPKPQKVEPLRVDAAAARFGEGDLNRVSCWW